MQTVKIILFLSCLISFFSKAIAQPYYQLNNGEHLDGKQSYILPKATFLIEVPAITTTYTRSSSMKTTYSDSQLNAFKESYGLDIDVYKKLKKDTTHITHKIAEDSIKVTVVASADHNKIFYVKPKRRWNITQAASFTYGTDGMITEGESSFENKTFDLVTKGIGSALSIAAAVRSLDQAAVIPSANKIDELDKLIQRYLVLERQTNVDIYKDLRARMEKDYAKAFAKYFYTAKQKQTDAKMYYTPPSNSAPVYDTDTTLNLFSIDSNGKIIYNEALDSDILLSKKMTSGKVSATKAYSLKLRLLPAAHQLMERAKNRPSTAPYFAYNIPAKVYVTLLSPSGESLKEDLYKIPQYGKIGYIQAKKNKLAFQLDPLTGELKKMSTQSTAISSDQVGAAGTLLTTATTTFKADDADTKLEKEVKRLEMEKKRRDLLKELNQ